MEIRRLKKRRPSVKPSKTQTVAGSTAPLLLISKKYPGARSPTGSAIKSAKRFNLGKDFVVVADSGLMNKNNVTLLQEAGYNYILGARIKSESASVKQWILSLEKVDKACYDYKRENGERLIVSYSDKRAKKDAYNRDRGIVRLRKAYKTGRITKSQVLAIDPAGLADACCHGLLRAELAAGKSRASP